MKKLLAIVISMAMIVAMMPVGVFADGEKQLTTNSHELTSGNYILMDDVTLSYENPNTNIKDSSQPISGQLEVPEGETVTIDLNGKVLTCTYEGISILNRGTLIIKDSSATEGKKGEGRIYNNNAEEISYYGHDVIRNLGDLTIESGTFGDKNLNEKDENANTTTGAALRNIGTATIDGGYFTCTDNYPDNKNGWSYAIRSAGTLTINGGKVYGSMNGGISADSGIVTINNVEVDIFGTKSFACLATSKDEGKFIVHGGKFIKKGNENPILNSFNGMPSWDATADLVANGYNIDGGTYIVNDEEQKIVPVAKIGETGYPTLQAAIAAASGGDTIKLLKDITVASIGKETKAPDSKGKEIIYYAIDKSITLDLNNKTLTTTQTDSTVIENNNNKVNIVNGKIVANELSGTTTLFNIKTGCELNIEKVKIDTNGCALFPQGDAAKLVCKNSEISAVTYAVGTNAGTTKNYNVQIILDHSDFSTTGADSCAVMINVKGSLKADYCTIVGGRQGLIVRAGDATVNNSEIISRTEYTNAANKYYIKEDGTVDNAWGAGNEVPQAGVVVGNYYNSSVSESSYAYLADAKLDITNTKISVVNSSFATIYLADNKTYKANMNINGNSNITGLLVDKTNLAESGIVIKGGTFTVDPDDYVYPGYTVTEKDGKFVVSAPYTPVAPSNHSTPTDNVTNNTTDKNTTADLTPAVKDNKAETTVDAKTADKIVDKAVANKSTEVIVDATGNNTVASSEVAIPEKTVKELAEKTDANLVIKTDNGKVDLDKTAVKALADQAGTDGTVKLVVETVKTDENICHVDLKLITSNGAVKDFRGGNVKVTINLTKELAAKELVCVYIDDNGIYTLVEGVLNADGTYTFTTGHFSEYAVMAKAEADKKIAEQLDTLINEVNLKVRTSKTAKKNIKAVVSGDITALTDAGYTVKYKFYRSEKKASKYVSKGEKTADTYINTAGKKGAKYYYKAKAMVYSGDTLVGQTVLKQCKYGVRTWSK